MRKVNIELIENERMNRKLTKTQFYDLSGVDSRTYSRILRNPNATVNDCTLFKIAKTLDIIPSELVSFNYENLS